MMNNKFQLNNPVVENILNQRYCHNNVKNILDESYGAYGLLSFITDPLSNILQTFLNGPDSEKKAEFIKLVNELVNSEQLNMPAPKMRYSTPSGFQLSRASTIA